MCSDDWTSFALGQSIKSAKNKDIKLMGNRWSSLSWTLLGDLGSLVICLIVIVKWFASMIFADF